MRAACAQVWLVPYAPSWGERRQLVGAAVRLLRIQEAACSRAAAIQSRALPAILTRLPPRQPDPGRAVRLQDCKVSTFGRALHRLDQVQAAWRAAAAAFVADQFAVVAKSRFSEMSA